MNQGTRESRQVFARDLEQVIEPLASYICAADQPRAVLMAALAVLFTEIEVTSRAARAQIASFAGNSCS